MVEEKDFSVRGVVWFGIGLAIMIVCSLALVVWFFSIYQSMYQAGPAPSPLATARQQLPPAPRLQVSPEIDLSALRAREDSVLYSYGWVDRDKGVVRIPIGRAMEIVVEKGMETK